MLRRFLLIVLVLFTGLMALGAFVVQAFGWLGLVAVLGSAAVGGYVFARFLPRFLMAAATAPLRRRGRVLAGATVKVNAFLPAEPPGGVENAWEGEEPPQELPYDSPQQPRFDWYTLDVTITPASSLRSEPETLMSEKWQPALLMVVPADATRATARSFLEGLPYFDGRMPVVVAERLVWDGLDWGTHHGEEVWGIQRLRLHLGIPDGVRRIEFLYQMVIRFGDIAVPPHRNAIPGG